MALSVKFAKGHIDKWSSALGQYSAFRGKWPSRLFHHAPLENALGILKHRKIFARNDPANPMSKDIAAEGVIDNNAFAHDFARLYFRPRTPTQFNIEGIRRDSECRYGASSHAPILVMFVFDAFPVLTMKGTYFSDRNMQRRSARVGESDEFFGTIPFDKVFHEGGTGGDRSITDHRCAEVLTASGLSLQHHLQWIYCRSAAEKSTLINYIGPSIASVWFDKIVVSDDMKVFEKRYCFVEYVALSNKGVVFRLNPRIDGESVSIRIRAWRSPGDVLVVNFANDSFSPVPPKGGRWITPAALADGLYKVKIEIEGKLAFEDLILLGDDLF